MVYQKYVSSLLLSLNDNVTWVILPDEFFFLLRQVIVAHWVIDLVTILIDSGPRIFCCLQVIVEAAVPF